MVKGFTGIIIYCMTQKELVNKDSNEFHSKVNNLSVSGADLKNIVYVLNHMEFFFHLARTYRSGIPEIEKEGLQITITDSLANYVLSVLLIGDPDRTALKEEDFSDQGTQNMPLNGKLNLYLINISASCSMEAGGKKDYYYC